MDAEGANPSSAAQGANPTSAAQGATPTPAAQGAAPTSAAQGATPTSAPEEAPLGIIRAGRGKYFEILDEGLRVTTRTGCFSSPEVKTTSWDDFRRCDVETWCFSGAVTLSQADGDSISLKVPLQKVRRVATAIFQHINLGKHGKVDPELSTLLGKRPKVVIFGTGLLLARSAGWCHKSSTFVPWEAVVSLRLRPGCCSSHVILNTLLEDPAKNSPPSTDEASKNEQEVDTGPAYLKVNIRGEASAMEQVFQMLLQLMNDGKPPEPLPDVKEVPETELTTLGLMTAHRNVKFALPWSSIASVDLQVTCWKPKLVLTDCTGAETVLRKIVPGEFDAVRTQIAKAKGENGTSAATEKPIVRRNIRLASNGITLMTRHLCSATSQFIPWMKIDALEMRVNCCGGSLMLITETGTRVQVCSAGLFGKKEMDGLAKRIQDMKYGRGHHSSDRIFAAPEGSSRACVLTDSSVRLVSPKGCCKRIVRVVDLDSVNSCEAFSTRQLRVTMRESMNMDDDEEKPGIQPLEVWLQKTDDSEDIAADMMKRASGRKKKQ